MDIIKMNEKAYERIASDYAKDDPGTITPGFRRFCEKLPAACRVLDVGSGTGIPHAKYLANRGFQVKGIDISKEMVKISRKNVPKAEFRVLSMTEMDYKREFEGIIACASMNHLDFPRFQEVAKKISQAFKPNGWFYLSLFEPVPGADGVSKEVNVESNYSSNWGVPLYSRAYTKKEVLDVFIPLQMQLQEFHREIVYSKRYGEEYKMEYLFQMSNF